MKFDKIIGFGDSWTYGDELLDPELASRHKDAHPCWVQNTHYRESHCYLGLLGQHYGVPVENFGIPGGSMTSSIWTLLWWLEHEPNPERCLVLVGHTDSDRMTFYDPNHVSYANDPPWNKFIHSAWVEYGSSVISQPWREMVKQQIVLVNSPGWRRINYQQTVLTFDGIAARHGIPMMQYHIMPEELRMDLPTMIWPGFDFVTFFLRHPDNRDRRYYKPGGHPNESGHVIIAELLQKQIDSATM